MGKTHNAAISQLPKKKHTNTVNVGQNTIEELYKMAEQAYQAR
jgi:galactose-1-phosphate uridylyltransferase